MGEVLDHFDDRRVEPVALRKPDPANRLVCDELGVAPAEAVFLDDLGVNLKPAGDGHDHDQGHRSRPGHRRVGAGRRLPARLTPSADPSITSAGRAAHPRSWRITTRRGDGSATQVKPQSANRRWLPT